MFSCECWQKNDHNRMRPDLYTQTHPIHIRGGWVGGQRFICVINKSFYLETLAVSDGLVCRALIYRGSEMMMMKCQFNWWGKPEYQRKQALWEILSLIHLSSVKFDMKDQFRFCSVLFPNQCITIRHSISLGRFVWPCVPTIVSTHHCTDCY